MGTLLWILQVLLAVVLLITGTTKLTQPRRKLAAGMMKWAADVSDEQFRAVGLLEVLAAIGLVLPAALNIAPVLTPLAATGVALMMVVATATHMRLDEGRRATVPIVILLMAVVVAVLRFWPHGFPSV